MRKNIIKITAIALLSCFALTACDDDIIAKPTGYDDNSPIVDVTDVYDNNFQDIYDSIRSGNLAGDVLNELLYQYSVSVFGNYNKVTAKKMTSKVGEEEITLKDAVDSYRNGDKELAKKFIKSHRAYWVKNQDGDRVDKDGIKVEHPETADPSENEYERLSTKWDAIDKRIAKNLYSAISGGAYNERNIFSEKRFLNTLSASIENKVVKASTLTDDDLFEGVITPNVEDYEVFTKPAIDVDGTDSVILHRSNYQDEKAYDLTKDETGDEAITYVEDKIIPDIYRQLLVEQYIMDESFDTLGRTSARHISVLSIGKNANYAKGAADLMNTFAKDYIFDKTRKTPITLDTFKMVSNAWVGTFMNDKATYRNAPEYEIMKKAVPDYFVNDADAEPSDKAYIQGTAYGDMMEEIEKIDDNPALSENESSYTGNNAYPVEIGKQIKTNELDLIDHTSTGWYVKANDGTGLPESIKNQLFDINVANALSQIKPEECVTYDATGGDWVVKESSSADVRGDYINVVGKIKLKDNEGKEFSQYFLRNTTRIKDDPFYSDILFESDGTYYIVLVEDAIRSTNLNKANYGKEKLSYKTLETYINEIVNIVADNDTYKTLSKKHWVENMKLKYHDQVIYDYFKSNFPELFDDED